MKLRMIVLSCLVLFVAVVLAHAQTWTQIGPEELSWARLDVSPHVEGLVFVNTTSSIWRSEDSGDTWTQAVVYDIPWQTLDLTFHPTNPNIVWGSGVWNSGQTDWFLSTNGGQTFYLHNFGFPDVYGYDQDGSVQFRYDPFDLNHMIAWNPWDPTLFTESFDEGQTWSDAWPVEGIPDSLYFFGDEIRDLAFDPHQQDRLVATLVYYAFPTPQFTLIQSLDGGHTWQGINDEPMPLVDATNDLTFHPTIPGLIFARYYGFAELGGFINRKLVSFDNGASIDYIPDPLTMFCTVQVTTDGTIYGANQAGVFSSTNGQSWTPLLPDNARWPMKFGHWTYHPPEVSVAWWDPDILFLNNNGNLYRSVDGGETWNAFGPTGSSKNIDQVISSPDGQTVFAVTRAGISLSTDGGDSWQPQFCAQEDVNLVISPSDPEHLLFRWEDPNDYNGYYEYLHMSPDNGEHWSMILDSYPHTFAFDPEDPDRIYTDWQNCFSTDGGQTWQQADLDNGVDVFRFDPDEPNAVYAITRYSGVSKSEDNGVTYSLWGDPDNGYTDANFRAGDDHAVFFDPYPGSEFALYSYDNGLTFDHAVSSPTEPRTDKVLFTPSGALAALCEDGLYESFDEGLSWQRVEGDYSVYLASYDYPTAWTIAENGTVFIAAEDGGLWRGEDVLGVDEDEKSAPLADEFELLCVYPNPFNPELTVTVTLPAPSNIEIQIVNIAGQTVATLTHGEALSAGVHDFTFDGSTYASGIYFVRADIPGHQSQLRKVTLLK